MNTTAENYSAIANHNLSSVLSQIQDNGPAYAESMARSSRNTPAPDRTNPGNTNYNETAANKQDDDLYGDDTVSLSSSGSQKKSQHSAANTATTKKEISPGIWLQLLLLLISAALLASTLFKLDAQSNDIEKSLSFYDENIDEKIQESVDLLKKKSFTGTTKIHASLQALQDELQHIKTDYAALDKKYIALVESAASEENKGASSLQKEITSLKTELQVVKNKIKTADNKNIAATKVAASNDLVVNLASLTNKSQAEKIMRQLHAEGLLPSMQQAVVRGERVYRLSVSGFFNRDEAESFIRKADKKYGMKDSRIRKS